MLHILSVFAWLKNKGKNWNSLLAEEEAQYNVILTKQVLCAGKDEGSKLSDNSVSQANTYPLHSALVKANHLE